jgi:hypothetical protein
MSNIVTMSGAPLVTHRDLLEGLIAREDVSHVTIVVSRMDGFLEVLYDRQQINEIVMASSTLAIVANDLARGTIDDDA